MNYRLYILFFLIVICGLAACKKQNYDVPNPPGNPPVLNVINATADSLDYFINGNRQNNVSDIYPNGATAYLPVLAGAGSYSLKKAGSQITLFQQSLTLDTGVFYSLFVCGTTADKIFLNPDSFSQATINITDSLDLSAVRFVNASPNAGNVEIVVSTAGKTSIDITNLAFKSITTFYKVRDTLSDVKVYAAGTTQLLKDTTISPIGGQIYTLFTKGTSNAKGAAAFGAVLINNVPIISQQQIP